MEREILEHYETQKFWNYIPKTNDTLCTLSFVEGRVPSSNRLRMRRRFLVLYKREEKAGGLAKMQALVLVVLAVITQKKIRPGSGTLF